MNYRKKIVHPLVSLISGGVAGAVEAVATVNPLVALKINQVSQIFIQYPFEFAKTSVQLQNTYNSNNPLKVLYRVYRTHGVSSIYTGCSTLVVGTTGKAAVRFLSFDTVKSQLSDSSGKLGPIQGIVAGMGAGVIESVFAVTPSERIKTALISDAKGPKRFRNGGHATRIIFMERGIRGFYQGLLATTLKQSATSAVRMGTYSALKEEWRARGLPASSVATFGIGVVAGIITVYATQPFDTVKTRTQSSVGARTKEAFFSVVSESGVSGLWKGSTMRLGRLMFSGGIVFTIYEKVCTLLSGS